MDLYLSDVVDVPITEIDPPETEIVTEAKTLVANGPIYFADITNGSFVLTLPSTPNINDKISIYDAVGEFAYDPPIIFRNGNLIMGEDKNISLNVSNTNVEFVYIGSPLGWQVSLGIV